MRKGNSTKNVRKGRLVEQYFQISKAVADVPPISKEMKTIQDISDILSIINLFQNSIEI